MSRVAVAQGFDPVDLQRQMASGTINNAALCGVVRDALVRHFGSLKAAAIEMEMDQGQLTRELETGKLNVARLAKCGAIFMLKFGELMVEHAQPLASPKVRGFQMLSEIEKKCAEIRQLLEFSL